MIFGLSLWSLGIATRAWMPTMVLFFFEADAYMNFFIWRSRDKICRMYDSYYFDYFLLPDLVLIDFFTREYAVEILLRVVCIRIAILWILMSLNLVRFDLLEVIIFPNYLQTQKYESLVTGTDVIHSFAVTKSWVKVGCDPRPLKPIWVKVTCAWIYYGQCSGIMWGWAWFYGRLNYNLWKYV